MRDAFYKLTAPLFARIPDPSRQPARRQAAIGLGAAVLFHILLLLFALAISALLPGRSPIDFAKAKAKLQEIELTVIPPEEEERKEEEARVVPLAEIMRPRPFMDSLGLASSAVAPEQAVFESDLNMIAASELSGTGLLPLPTQEGRVYDFPMFTDQRVTLGANAVPFPMDVGLMTAPPPAAPASKDETAPEKSPPAAPAAQLAKLEPKPKLTEVNEPAADEIAVAEKPRATPAPVTMPKLREDTVAAATPVPRATSPGYQPQQQKTRIEGGDLNKGKNAVDAVGTPLGRYEKATKDAIGSRWYLSIEPQRSLLPPGRIKVRFLIHPDGKISDLKMTQNTSSATFEEICARAVLQTKLPPMSPHVIEALGGQPLDMSFSFTLETPF